MDKIFLIQLTNKIYKLTILFPKKEPLRYKMRELADNILAEPNESDLEDLNNFFEVAKDQNWISLNDLLSVQQDYDNLRRELESVKTEEEREDLKEFSAEAESFRQPLLAKATISERQEKILKALKEKGQAQVWEIKQIFPQVTKRTLRRDFERMLSQGLIKRMGERNNTFYLPCQLSNLAKID